MFLFYSVTYLYQYRPVDISFTLWVISDTTSHDSGAQIDFIFGSSSMWSLCSSDTVHLCGVYSFASFLFAAALESAISLKDTGSSYWRIFLVGMFQIFKENKTWKL